MTEPHKLRKGQEVSITFTGIVAHSDYNAVSLRHPDGPTMPITWSDRLTPKIKVIGHDFQRGDIGVYEGDGITVAVIFRPRESSHGRGPDGGRPAGWYSSANAPYGRIADPNSPHVRPVMRYDGSSF